MGETVTCRVFLMLIAGKIPLSVSIFFRVSNL